MTVLVPLRMGSNDWGLAFDLRVVIFRSLLLGRVLWGTLYITTPSLGYIFWMN